MNRDQILAQVATTTDWDIVVIGGGATGLGCAVDAASRGYKILLAEQYDFGKGTSGKSTKLVHGGVRYLAQGNIKLVMDALRERAYLLSNAPHVTSVMAFIVPVYSFFDKWFYSIGLKVYDLLAGRLSLGKTKWLNKQEAIQQLPGINADKLRGGVLYYDGQFDDTRLAIDLAATAVAQGATVVNYCKAEAVVKTNGSITGIRLKDTLNNKEYSVKAKVVINATGVFADAVMKMDEPLKDNLIAPSQGIHLVVDQSFFPGAAAMMIPKTDDGRVLFAVPWHSKILLGTTDTPVASIAIEPRPLEEEISFILHHANRYLAQTITRKEVRSVFAGLRPLIKKKGAAATSVLSRDHTIIVSRAGLITVSGGKWTTYRKMAEEVVTKAAVIGKLLKNNCVTRTLRIQNSFTNMDDDKTGFLHPDFPFTKLQIQHFVEQEMAMTVEDILARRTRILFLNAAVAMAVAPLVAEQMAALLYKDAVWIEEQVIAFTQLAAQYSLPA